MVTKVAYPHSFSILFVKSQALNSDREIPIIYPYTAFEDIGETTQRCVPDFIVQTVGDIKMEYLGQILFIAPGHLLIRDEFLAYRKSPV